MRSVPFLVASWCLVAVQLPVHADIVFEESSRNPALPPGQELSTFNDAPTVLGTFGIGQNIVIGEVTDIGVEIGIPDDEQGFNDSADIFSFTIAPGSLLDSIVMLEFDTSSGSSGMFMGVDDAAQFAFSKAQINAQDDPLENSEVLAEIVTYGIVGFDSGDLLENAFVSSPASLGPGDYTVYIQETLSFSRYNLAFNVVAASAVPEASSLAFCALLATSCGAGLSLRRRRRARI